MTGALLAGGQSRRMGFNKALIKIDGSTIIERSVRLFKDGFDEVMIIANDVAAYENLDTRIYTDIYKGAGSLGGIYTALFHSASDYAFIAACDMPLLDLPSIKRMLEQDRKSDALIPFINGKFHPLHGLYSKRCMKTIEAMIKEGNLKINDLLSKINTVKLTEEAFDGVPIALSVENVNTEEDLKILRYHINEKS